MSLYAIVNLGDDIPKNVTTNYFFRFDEYTAALAAKRAAGKKVLGFEWDDLTVCFRPTVFEEAALVRAALFSPSGYLRQYLWGGAKPDLTTTLEVLSREVDGIPGVKG